MKKHGLKFHEELESENIFDIKIKKSKGTYRKLSIVGCYTFKLICTNVHVNSWCNIFYIFWSMKKHVKETWPQIS